MFKRIIYFLVLVFSLTLTSCKKVNDHKVKFEIEFIEDCQDGYSDMIDVICKPSYNDEQSDIPSINKENIKPGFVWKYEYWELRDGDKVLFTVMPQQGYHFIMKVYLDDKLVSYREVITGYGGYYVTTTIDIWGINNEASSDSGIIEFVYSE
jgi:hypothetical protein